jgi:hypothetical protein
VRCPASLDALRSEGTITAYHREDGAVTLEVAALAAGATFTAHYRVVATLAGQLNAAASGITAATFHRDLPPHWVVR